MQIKKRAQSGSFESSDILIVVEPVEAKTGRIIEMDSTVNLQFGDSIQEEITKSLDKYKIEDIKIIASDKGALPPTIGARLETAIKRAMEMEEGTLQ